jgi:indolepyruvate decarboxylase
MAKGVSSRRSLSPRVKSDRESLREVLQEAVPRINAAKRPVFIIGNEVHRRFGVRKPVQQLIEKSKIPFVTLMQSKSVLSEAHPLFIGVYEGRMGREDVRNYVEKSDCLILLGAELTDFNLGVYTAKIHTKFSIFSAQERTSIAHHHFRDVLLEDFVGGLIKAPLKKRALPSIPRPESDVTFAPVADKKITVKRLFECVNAMIEDHHIIIADPGDALFAGCDLFLHDRIEFMSCAYYASLGFAVPAAIGAQCADPQLRPLVLVGDGAFQMTGTELSTAVRFGLNPIVIVLNNRGYGTERPMADGIFNDILNWKYNEIPFLFGVGRGFSIYTEQDLLQALAKASRLKEFCILDVHLGQFDFSPALQRLTTELSRRMKAA